MCTCRQDGEDTGLLLLAHTVGCPAQQAAVVHLRGRRVEGRGPAPITDQYSGPLTNHRSVFRTIDQSQLSILYHWPIRGQYSRPVTNQKSVFWPLTNQSSVLPGGVGDDVPGRDGPQLRAGVELPPAQVIQIHISTPFSISTFIYAFSFLSVLNPTIDLSKNLRLRPSEHSKWAFGEKMIWSFIYKSFFEKIKGLKNIKS